MSLDSFPNFQFDTVSQYGGAPLDDTASVISGYTNGADSLLNGGEPNGHKHPYGNKVEDEFENVLDDFKEGPVDLPPHACRCADSLLCKGGWLTGSLLVTAVSITQHPL
jgi:hypothetical protein